MKYLILALITLTFIQCKAQSPIGIVKNGKAELTANQNQLLKTWNKNLLSQSKIDAQLKTIEIILIEDSYYLRGKGLYTSTILLNKDSKDILRAEGISCTSSGCSTNKGCIPTKSKTSCTDCFGDCTKTVSSNALTDIGAHE